MLKIFRLFSFFATWPFLVGKCYFFFGFAPLEVKKVQNSRKWVLKKKTEKNKLPNFDLGHRIELNNNLKLIKLWFLIQILIFDQSFDFWPKFWFLTKIVIFDPNFDFWPKFWFLTKILIFDASFDFWPKFWFFTLILIFDSNFDFWPVVLCYI